MEWKMIWTVDEGHGGGSAEGKRRARGSAGEGELRNLLTSTMISVWYSMGQLGRCTCSSTAVAHPCSSRRPALPSLARVPPFESPAEFLRTPLSS